MVALLALVDFRPSFAVATCWFAVTIDCPSLDSVELRVERAVCS